MKLSISKSQKPTIYLKQYDDGWVYEGKICSKLRNKSAIGRPLGQEQLLLTSAEIIYCHKHRQLEFPSENWLREAIIRSPKLLDEAIILEALRISGNKIVIYQNFGIFKLNYVKSTWALRWDMGCQPNSENPVAEVKWFHSSEDLNVENIFSWAEEVSNKNRIPEILIIDDEHSVVTYRVSKLNPKGKMNRLHEKKINGIANLDSYPLDNGGCFITSPGDWEDERIGIPHHGGRILDNTNKELIDLLIDPSLYTIGADILRDLLNRGLFPRPGFKYGTKWRCYDNKLGNNHSPWLVIHPDEAPKNWEGVCLAARLSSGVGKIWLYPLNIQGIWNYLSIIRPPTECRWKNPDRK